MRLFFDAHIAPGIKNFTLSEEESKHICKVLRMQVGDQIALVNGKGFYFETEIFDANPKKCEVKILNEKKEAEKSYNLHIAIAPTKLNDRMEWFLEKATEIGVTEITFLLTQKSERKEIKIERFEKILISAMKQSKRLFLPKLNALVKIEKFIQENPKGLIAHCENGEKSTISMHLRSNSCPILIGPEGDFTPSEIELALKSGYLPIQLGETRLRTETAGIYAVVESMLILDK